MPFYFLFIKSKQKVFTNIKTCCIINLSKEKGVVLNEFNS